MTKDQFRSAMPGLNRAQVDQWYEPMENAMFEFAIVSTNRAAMFLATVGHESGDFKWLAEIWGPTPAQKRYDGREDLGNTRPEAIAIAKQHGVSPGRWWAGHGPIQITGYDNHLQVGRALGLDLLNDPELLTIAKHGARASAWWWANNDCNNLADTGDFLAVSRRVNLGNTKTKTMPNGWDDRLARYNRARKAL